MIVIVVKFAVRPEYADGWPDIVRPFTEATRAEPGNLWFEWARSVEDPTTYVLLEAFRDDAAEAHVGSDHFAAAMALLPGFVRAVPEIINYQMPGEEWSRLVEMQPSS